MFVYYQASSCAMKKTKIYYVEDEPSLGRIVSDTLGKQGYDITWEKDGSGVLTYFQKETPDICILDIMLPKNDGLALCRTIKSIHPRLPVIFLTAKTDTSQVVAGFESGGTDYIRKPFSIEELIVRIENQLTLSSGRRSNVEMPDCISLGKYNLDSKRYELRSGRRTIKLSNRDMQLLVLLLANKNNITSRKDLLMSIWGDDSYFNSRNLDVCIRKLRRYFSDDDAVQIVTLKGNGYLFIVP
jgi:DNA-binding response OmpR family regulator